MSLSLNTLCGHTAWNVSIRGGGCDEYGRHTPSARAAPAGARLLALPGDLRRRPARHRGPPHGWPARYRDIGGGGRGARDRKSTRLNSSHVEISYAVFCL